MNLEDWRKIVRPRGSWIVALPEQTNRATILAVGPDVSSDIAIGDDAIVDFRWGDETIDVGGLPVLLLRPTDVRAIVADRG